MCCHFKQKSTLTERKSSASLSDPGDVQPSVVAFVWKMGDIINRILNSPKFEQVSNQPFQMFFSFLRRLLSIAEEFPSDFKKREALAAPVSKLGIIEIRVRRVTSWVYGTSNPHNVVLD